MTVTNADEAYDSVILNSGYDVIERVWRGVNRHMLFFRLTKGVTCGRRR